MISAYTLAVEDVFAFADGRIVFVGRTSTEPGPSILAPCNVDVVVDDQLLGQVHLCAERSSGHRPGLRSVETRSHIDVAAVRGRRCVLVHRCVADADDVIHERGPELVRRMPRTRDHITAAFRDNGVNERIAECRAVVLERLAYGGALWYWCPDLESLRFVEERVRSGSVVSCYFDGRIEDMQLGSDAASRSELIEKLAAVLEGGASEFREALVGTLEADRVSVGVDYLTSVDDVRSLVASLPDGLTFYGTFPDRSNDGRDAITFTVPDPDGVVRQYPH